MERQSLTNNQWVKIIDGFVTLWQILEYDKKLQLAEFIVNSELFNISDILAEEEFKRLAKICKV